MKILTNYGTMGFVQRLAVGSEQLSEWDRLTLNHEEGCDKQTL